MGTYLTKRQFYRYLKEKLIYKKWLNNLKLEIKRGDRFNIISKYGSIKKFIEFYSRHNMPEEIIMYGFGWDEAPEGPNFWSNVYDEIRDIRNGQKTIEECCVGAST